MNIPMTVLIARPHTLSTTKVRPVRNPAQAGAHNRGAEPVLGGQRSSCSHGSCGHACTSVTSWATSSKRNLKIHLLRSEAENMAQKRFRVRCRQATSALAQRSTNIDSSPIGEPLASPPLATTGLFSDHRPRQPRQERAMALSWLQKRTDRGSQPGEPEKDSHAKDVRDHHGACRDEP